MPYNNQPDPANPNRQEPDYRLLRRAFGHPARSWSTYHGTKIVDGLPKKRVRPLTLFRQGKTEGGR